MIGQTRFLRKTWFGIFVTNKKQATASAVLE
jgi:hypothetical protein